MGRYYSGDIDGKFMFAVQPSNAGERFFARESEPEFVDYEVSRYDYLKIIEELEKIKSSGSVDRVQDMFDKTDYGWNDTIQKENGVSDHDLSEYADYKLGMKIKVWFDENPEDNYLNFIAEL
jgi:hypothetical protein